MNVAGSRNASAVSWRWQNSDPTRTSTQVTRYAILEWEPGQGPVMPIPYQVRSGFVTHARARQVNDDVARMSVSGVVRKSDGTPGQQTWKSEPYNPENIPASVRAMLAALLAEERSRG